MQVTVIGIYDNIDEVRATEGDLESTGFNASDMSIASENEGLHPEHEAGQNEGGVKRFFRDLLGLDEAEPDRGASTRGKYVLTLYADEARASVATDVMNRHHPLEQRVEEQRDVTPGTEPVSAGAEPVQSLGGIEMPSQGDDIAGAGDGPLYGDAPDVPPHERYTREDGALGSVPQSFGPESLGRQPYVDLGDDASISGSLTGARANEEYRAHFDENYAASGGRYEEYLIAYQYGAALAQDKRYAGGSFEQHENELRRDWEASQPNSRWEQFKGAVRHGWDRATQKSEPSTGNGSYPGA